MVPDASAGVICEYMVIIPIVRDGQGGKQFLRVSLLRLFMALWECSPVGSTVYLSGFGGVGLINYYRGYEEGGSVEYTALRTECIRHVACRDCIFVYKTQEETAEEERKEKRGRSIKDGDRQRGQCCFLPVLKAV